MEDGIYIPVVVSLGRAGVVDVCMARPTESQVNFLRHGKEAAPAPTQDFVFLLHTLRVHRRTASLLTKTIDAMCPR
jgi:hypothetical protein